MSIVSIGSKLLKTVGLFVVRLNLAKLRSKNRKENEYFWLKSKFYFFALKNHCFGCQKVKKGQNKECHTSLNS